MSYLILFALQLIYSVLGSYKKGVVHVPKEYECDDFKVLNNMAWWYDYRQNLDYYYKNKICVNTIGNYIQTYVPMIWGRNSKTNIPDVAKYVLGYNEPNHISQANMTAIWAADMWVAGIKPLKRNGRPKLVSPSAAQCGKNCVDDRDNWFKVFLNRCTNRYDCQIDYLATHTYMCNANQVMRHLDRLYGNHSLPIWLTEFACGNETDPIVMLDFMKDILPRLEAAPHVYRYSWYKARVTEDHYVKKAASLLDPLRTSTLTPLGIFYNGFEGTVKVDGVWGEWKGWSACGVSCGGGQRSRSRKCIYPNPSQTDYPCVGDSVERKNCNTQACPTPKIDGVWGRWDQWSACGVTCGGGQRSRSRTCIYSDPANKGDKCPGRSTATETCNSQSCPVDGVWGRWDQWSACGATCGGGLRSRSRTCIYSNQSNKGKPCTGRSTAIGTCNLQACPVDGVWGWWWTWSACGVSCGGGQRYRARTCKYPDPLNKGQPCTGRAQETETCNSQACSAADGVWGWWWTWSACGVTCGGGQRYRARTCKYPDPLNKGQPCTGRAQETETCNSQACSAADGVWGWWWTWSACGVTCGGGQRYRARTCKYPDPLNKGQPCTGRAQETETCNSQACSADGVWGWWWTWSACGVSCGGGQRYRARTCKYPDPLNKGQPCTGRAQETETCNSQACSADGVWGDWSVWSQCSVNCGQGIRKRTRTCMASSNGCHGASEESKECSGVNCIVSVDGTWTIWLPWSTCSATCGIGTMTRTRTCWWPTNVIDGKDCDGSNRETKICQNTNS